ncbi:MAG: KH domain-containing protein [Candidatus Pacebacteria bacterium]|jgi:spoIIIJ-associated protein|nr:KH domain-containing protein [Candidatus Paceibacterota bacterium]MBT3512119.1 KH domain-containing protein [Candidatus Paceibacterota bacterium]MBT4005419.1 KH domain-containing protein [Candidatus Paceibacterota bacterium]MBT4359128.1 KH domain-containing protein [Candidatus Paceibacterota bacterium]MBT4680955.1 KH domain-containing protein [Candidatus Paceibacterota bacterium]
MKIEEYLISICQHLGLVDDQFKVEMEKTDEAINAKIVLPEEESGLFIGYHGETLQAIQRMIRISFYEELGEKRFKLNVNDYREQRQDQLKERIVNIAQRVLETGESYTFSYLSAHDRFLTHTILAEDERFADLESKSEGEGRDRYLSIQLKKG